MDISYHCGSPVSLVSFSDITFKCFARGSPLRYTRWPNPMIFSLLASFSLIYESTRSIEPISVSIFITASLAPPWRGPFKAPIAAVIPEYTSDRVATQTRDVNVEAFNSWSAWRTNALLNASSAMASGSLPDSIYRKLAAKLKSLRGATGSKPFLIRAKDVTTVGTFAWSLIALR